VTKEGEVIMSSRIVGAAALLLCGAYMGGVVCFVLAPSVWRLPGPAYVRYWQALDHDYGRVMPVLLLPCLLLLAAMSALSWQRGALALALALAATALLGLAVVVTLTWMEPLNRVADSWDPDRLPADWAATRDQWLRWHYLRTGLSVGAFLCVLAWVIRPLRG
jgi:hypothetical protein